MGLDPQYGTTPVDWERADALEPGIIDLFDGIPSHRAIYDLESQLLQEARTRFLEEIDDGQLLLNDILTTTFLSHLHGVLFGGIWKWAGTFRSTDLNIGVEPRLIQMELHSVFGNLAYQWNETTWLSAHELGIAAHAELVRIHPFVDGNGRATRLMADLIYAAAQPRPHSREYDWVINKTQYIELLQAFDLNRDPKPLGTFIKSFDLGR